VRSKAREIAEVHRREATQQDKITTATRELAEAEAELANLGVYEPPKEEIVSHFETMGLYSRTLHWVFHF
jgi:hypothetical protein